MLYRFRKKRSEKWITKIETLETIKGAPNLSIDLAFSQPEFPAYGASDQGYADDGGNQDREKSGEHESPHPHASERYEPDIQTDVQQKLGQRETDKQHRPLANPEIVKSQFRQISEEHRGKRSAQYI